MTRGAYYNEIDPYAAQWLRNLIAAGHIAPGDVDERSIEDVRPDELRGYAQHHFFAGIGIWSSALRLAGWPDDRPVWTGSCPCQPFSAAGKQGGFDDERHLWPAWHWLIDELRPSVVLGEQVASAHADDWIDLVQTDLEGLGYAVGALAFPAAGVGAPHIRDRMYWLAYADDARLEGWRGMSQRAIERAAGARYVDGRLDYAERDGLAPGWGADACNDGAITGATGTARELADSDGDAGELDGLGTDEPATGPTDGFWSAADWIFCRDGRWRPVEPGTFPLAHGAPARVGRLRAYGNAIVRQAAAAWIQSAVEAIDEFA